MIKKGGQLLGAFCAAAVAAVQIFYVAVGAPIRSDFTTLSGILYVAFFLVCGLYSRFTKPLAPVLSVREWQAWLALGLWVLLIAIIYAVRADSVSNLTEFNGHMPAHAILAGMYGFGAIVLLMGDDSMWPLSRALKFGRGLSRDA